MADEPRDLTEPRTSPTGRQRWRVRDRSPQRVIHLNLRPELLGRWPASQQGVPRHTGKPAEFPEVGLSFGGTTPWGTYRNRNPTTPTYRDLPNEDHLPADPKVAGIPRRRPFTNYETFNV